MDPVMSFLLGALAGIYVLTLVLLLDQRAASPVAAPRPFPACGPSGYPIDHPRAFWQHSDPQCCGCPPWDCDGLVDPATGKTDCQS